MSDKKHKIVVECNETAKENLLRFLDLCRHLGDAGSTRDFKLGEYGPLTWDGDGPDRIHSIEVDGDVFNPRVNYTDGEKMTKDKLAKLVKVAYTQPKYRKKVLAFLRESGFIEDWGDREVENPNTGNKVKVKSLDPNKSPEQEKLLKRLEDDYNRQKTDDSDDDDADKIIEKYELKNKDLKELKEKSHKVKKGGPKKAKPMQKIKKEFMEKAKKETKKKMKDMSLKEFEVLYKAVLKDEDEEDGNKKESSLRKATIVMAYQNPELREDLLPLITDE